MNSFAYIKSDTYARRVKSRPCPVVRKRLTCFTCEKVQDSVFLEGNHGTQSHFIGYFLERQW